MERLTTKEEFCDAICPNPSECEFGCDFKDIKEMYNKLKEYEDLEEQGLFLKLPCKVGDNIWWFNKGKLIESKVTSFSVNKDGVERIYVKYFYYIGIKPFYAYGIDVKEFGKSVFLTKEEAEKALERLEKENE